MFEPNREEWNNKVGPIVRPKQNLCLRLLLTVSFLSNSVFYGSMSWELMEWIQVRRLEIWRVTYIQLGWTSNMSRQKNDSWKIVRATTIPRPPLESSRQGKSRSSWSIFCKIYFWPLIFWNMWKQGLNKNRPSWIGFASSNTRLLRYQTLLRCIGSYGNYFFNVVKEVKLICVRLIISCSRVPAIV